MKFLTPLDVELRWLEEKAFELERLAAGLRLVASHLALELEEAVE